MAMYSLYILSFFAWHIVFGTTETVLAFIKGIGFIKCCHRLWAFWTISNPFLPGIVGVPWFLWQACHKKRPCCHIIWDIVKFLAFPLMIFVSNCRSFISLCRLNSEYDPEYEKIVIRAMELKVLKSIFDSCAQAMMQVFIFLRSNHENNHYVITFDTLLIVSIISVSLTCSKHINYEIYFMNECHLALNLTRTAINTVLYVLIVSPRIFAWALIWSYYGTIFSMGNIVSHCS